MREDPDYIYGFVIVDSNTAKMDWDGVIHDTVEDAIHSLVGPYTSMSREDNYDYDGAYDQKTPWWWHYDIRPLGAKFDHKEQS